MSLSGRPSRGGPQLPYELLAGIEPCPAGWLVVSAKLQGIALAPQMPEVFERFTDILDYRPPFSVMAIHLPLGLPSKGMPGGRRCDRDARAILHWPRAAAIASPPSREELQAWKRGHTSVRNLSVVTSSLMPRIVEVYEHLGSYHQRTLFEVHPELSFFQLNDDRPLQYSKHSQAGREERSELLTRKIPGIERVLTAELQRVHLSHLLDGAAELWTARRLFARAVSRLPEDPEWDNDGLRMEIAR